MTTAREQIATMPFVAAQGRCWDDHETSPHGQPHADGSRCPDADGPAWEAVKRSDVLAILDAAGITAPDDLDERRAWFVYEAARLAAAAARAPIVPEPWETRDEAFRAQMIPVVARQTGPNRKSSAEELHDDWVRSYEAMGWTYGEVRDPVAKTHPDMVPYDDLRQLERDKDGVFMALCEIARRWVYER